MGSDSGERGDFQPELFRKVGAIVQGVVLGFLVLLAVMELASFAGHLSPFKYQGF